MKKALLGAVLGLALGVVSTLTFQHIKASSASVPNGLAQAYGDQGWRRLDARGDAALWVNRHDPFSYLLTKGQDLRVVVPGDADNHWLEVYDGNKVAVNVNWARKRIWNRSKQDWVFTIDPTEQPPERDK